jgi:cytochrome c oxidase subunit 4
MANDRNDSFRLPGPGERIRRLAENPVPTGGVPVPTGPGLSPTAQMAYAAGQGGADNFDHGAHDAHPGGHHPTAKTYVIIGVILTLITAVEVSAYYIEPWESSPVYVPSMLFLSAVKFVTVVMFYMHLKYDHKLFRALFSGPFVIAFTTLFGLMFLFGKLAIRLGILS